MHFSLLLYVIGLFFDNADEMILATFSQMKTFIIHHYFCDSKTELGH